MPDRHVRSELTGDAERRGRVATPPLRHRIYIMLNPQSKGARIRRTTEEAQARKSAARAERRSEPSSTLFYNGRSVLFTGEGCTKIEHGTSEDTPWASFNWLGASIPPHSHLRSHAQTH